MSKLRTLVVTGALVLPFASAASAADMPEFPLQEPPPPIVEEFTSGWYIRTDAAYRWNHVDSARDDFGISTGSNKLNDGAAIGIGFGYKYDWLRADITADYGGRVGYSGNIAGVITPTAKVDGFSILANAYLDLGTWWGITPYIGAGAGVAYLSMSDFATLPPALQTVVTQTRTNFAWAYMAGASMRIMPNLLVDVGYRHINLGDAITGVDVNRFHLKKISADEVRVGLRYTLD